MTVTHRWAAAGVIALHRCSVAWRPRHRTRVIAKVNGKTITEADMRLAETEIGSDLGSLPDGTKRRVLVEFLIENQLFADAAEGQKLGAGRASMSACSIGAGGRCVTPISTQSVKEPVSDAEAKKYYDQQVGALKPEEEVRARHILVESKDKAREIFEKIAARRRFRRSLPRRIPRTQARRTRAANSASSRADKWCRSSRRRPSS